jgi:hypothetical protein
LNTDLQSGGYASNFKNRIINGAMIIDQRNAGASVTSTGATYSLDRWRAYSQTPTSKYSAQQSSVAPNGFTNSALLTVVSAYTPVTSDFYAFQQFVEGFNIADLGWGTANAQPVTVSFWVRSSVTGTYSISLYNSDSSRSYPVAYTINSANTWEQKTITIAGDTSGTWLTNNGRGIALSFTLGASSDLLSTSGVWTGAGFKYGVTGQTQWIANAGATFYITGVQLEKGSTATSFDYRPYGTELALCQRYAWNLSVGGGGFFALSSSAYVPATNAVNSVFNFPVTMRTSPTSTSSAANTFLAQIGGTNFTPSAISAAGNVTQQGGIVSVTVTGATVGQGGVLLNNNTSANILFSAEL